MYGFSNVERDFCLFSRVGSWDTQRLTKVLGVNWIFSWYVNESHEDALLLKYSHQQV